MFRLRWCFAETLHFSFKDPFKISKIRVDSQDSARHGAEDLILKSIHENIQRQRKKMHITVRYISISFFQEANIYLKTDKLILQHAKNMTKHV